MIIGIARVSTTEQNLGLRYYDVKPAFDVSVDARVDVTEARKNLVSAHQQERSGLVRVTALKIQRVQF
jgi:hypothetical protein